MPSIVSKTNVDDNIEKVSVDPVGVVLYRIKMETQQVI